MVIRDKKGRIKKGSHLGKEFKKKCQSSFKGKKHTEEAKQKNREKHLGKPGYWTGKKRDPVSIESRKKSRESQLKRVAEGRHNNYKCGITPINHEARESLEYKLWREAVFSRDDYTCQKCKQKGGDLRAHHILNFATYLELRFAIDNGITLCKKCHLNFHKKYGKMNNTKGQLDEFLSTAV